MKRLLWASLAAAVVVSAVAGLRVAVAQGPGPSGQVSQAAPAVPRAWYSVNIVTVKPESVNEFIEFQKSQTIPMLQRAGIKVRDVWRSGAPFGEANTFTLVMPIDKFADYDLEPRALRVLGAEAGRAYQERNRRLVVSSRTLAIQDRMELSIPPGAGFKPVAGVLTLTILVSGHAPQYEVYLKNDLLPVLKRANVGGYLVSRTIFGGDANEYAAMQMYASFAEIDKGPLATRVLGAAAAQQLTAKALPHIASQRRELLRYVPDLSFRVTTSSEAR